MSNFDKSVTKLGRSGNGHGNGNGQGELESMLEELERSPAVARVLGNAPVIRQPGMHGAVSDVTERMPSVRQRIGAGDEAELSLVVYRDKDDVTTILNLTRLTAILAIVLVASAAANIFQYLRRPDRIVVGPSGRVLSINDRNFGEEEGVQFGPDHLTRQDKIYATQQFVDYLFRIDPATHQRDMEKALRMMLPDSAVKFSSWMKEQGILDRQQAESWQTRWSPMDVALDPNEPYTVIVIGKQEINKVINGAAVAETKQLRVTIKLVADSKGRADRNLRSGFLISYVDAHELNEPASATPRPATDTQKPVTAIQEQQP